MSGTTEAFSRVKIDALQRVASWILTDGVNSVSNTRCRTAHSPTASSETGPGVLWRHLKPSVILRLRR